MNKGPLKWIKNRTLPLLVGLILLIALHPLINHDSNAVNNIFPIALIGLPVLGVLAISHWRKAVPVSAMFVALIAWSGFGYRFDAHAIAAGSISYAAWIYYAYTIVVLATELLRNTALIDDRVYGGIAIFLLTAFLFASVHRHISAIDPGAYITTVSDTPLIFGWYDALYFSISTISTVGYGDIVPRSNWARSASMLEAISGVLITIVLIARLAALRSPGGNRHHD
ncbi:MAG: hypothetical protein EXS03_09155 [Phycisphaerales bacterium]|nr:hypothetical protein [Phycisphaerales bacterium]